MNEFRKYLLALQTHYSMLQKIIEQGENASWIEHSRWATALLDDIIHHFDEFVKWENRPDDLQDQGGPIVAEVEWEG